ncbi:MAG TPA: hypothetical protein VKZ18_24050 [Polyangia bacterium]|nr:hypothetical protein [Polyangia bacterium]
MNRPQRSGSSLVRSLPRALVASALACALAALPRAARAEDLAPPSASASSGGGGSAPSAVPGAAFGASGQWAVSVASYNSGTSLFFAKQASGGSTLFLQPALDYFITNGLSIGGLVGFVYGGGTTTVNVGARAGFNQALVDKVSFWPTAGIVGSFQSGNGTSSSSAKLVVLAPFLYHPAPHFFLGAGPFLSYLVKGGPDTQYGLDFVIGGWL